MKIHYSLWLKSPLYFPLCRGWPSLFTFPFPLPSSSPPSALTKTDGSFYFIECDCLKWLYNNHCILGAWTRQWWCWPSAHVSPVLLLVRFVFLCRACPSSSILPCLGCVFGRLCCYAILVNRIRQDHWILGFSIITAVSSLACFHSINVHRILWSAFGFQWGPREKVKHISILVFR